MFCIQEAESHSDPFSSNDKDPLSSNGHTQSESSDEEPNAKRLKTSSYISPELNLKVYQIPSYNTPKSLSIYPTTPTSSLPQFVNNPLNLANPLHLANPLRLNSFRDNNVMKNLQSRYSLPSKLTITPVHTPPKVNSDTGEVIRYKKNGEIAKKRGPPKGYKRKPKDLVQSFNSGALLQAQNAILTSLLATNTTFALSPTPQTLAVFPPTEVAEVPQVKIPEGVESVVLMLDPDDWFPDEPYKMVFSRKKNPKWKNFPYRCEYCFKGYRVSSSLWAHVGARHGGAAASLASACPCCPHVSARRTLHKRHIESHEGRRHRIFCPYCIPPRDPNEPYVKESEKYPFDKFPQYWYASEESLRLHKKRKHPYAAMLFHNWFGTWGESMPNS